MISIRSPGREGEHLNVKIKALAFVLMAVLLLCGCGQKSETAAVTPAQAATLSGAGYGIKSFRTAPAWRITM